MKKKFSHLNNTKKIKNKKIYIKSLDNNKFYKDIGFPEYLEPDDEDDH